MLHSIRRPRVFLPAILMLLLIGLAYLFHTFSIYLFKREIARASYEITVQQVTDTAAALAVNFSQPLALDTFSVAADHQSQAALLELIHRHPNIHAILLVDDEGRILMGCVNQDTSCARVFEDLTRLGHRLRGLSEAPLLETVRTACPQVQPCRIALLADTAELGWLRVFIDPQMPQAAVDLAASRMTFKLMSLFVLLSGLVLVFFAVIRRQTRVTGLLRDERDQAEQWAYVGTLAAGLAHEIRNPINALAMQFDLLEEDLDEACRQAPPGTPKPPATTARLERIRQGLAGIERTVHDFLTYAAPETPKPGLIDLAEALEPLRRDWQAVADRHEPPVGLVWTAPARLRCWFDVHALRQIVNNLLQNGLRAQSDSASPPRLTLSAFRSGRDVLLAVDDAGPGVPAADRAAIFTVFFSTRPDGTGLGLPIARRLAELNGGDLTLSPSPSPLGGARFLLRLPASARSGSHPADRRPWRWRLIRRQNNI